MPATQVWIQIWHLSLVAFGCHGSFGMETGTPPSEGARGSGSQDPQNHPCLRAPFTFLALPGQGSGSSSSELSDLSLSVCPAGTESPA